MLSAPAAILSSERQAKWRPFKQALDALRVPEGCRMLDVGCATGVVARMVAREFRASLVVGMDLNLERLTVARELADKAAVSKLSFVTADVRMLPFEHHSFDLVWSSFVLEYLAQQIPHVLQEFSRVVRPGGIVAVFDVDGFMIRHEQINPGLVRSLELWHRSALRRGFDPEIGSKLIDYFRGAGLLDVRAETFDDQELYSTGRPDADVIRSWRGRLAGMTGISQALGSEAAAERFRSDYLALISDPAHIATGKNWLVWGQVPS